ncbi:hypothetical protein ACB092_05G208700 [Castanea dentata]
MEFRAIQPKKQSPIARPRTKWKAPPGEMYKINFDGATFSDEDRFRIGVVIRNNQNMVMAPMSHIVPLPISVVELETLAMAKLLKFSHVGRGGNSVVHNLARHARHVTSFSVWMEDVPLHTLNVYQTNLLSL